MAVASRAERRVDMDVAPEATLEDVLAALGRQAPAIASNVLGADGHSLRPPYVMNLNGLDFVDNLDRKIQPDDRILIMAPPAGG